MPETAAREPRIIVELRDLRLQPVRLDIDLPAAWLDAAFAGLEYEARPLGGHLEAELSLVGTGVVLRGRTTARVATACGVCLAPTELAIVADLTSYLSPAAEADELLGREELTPEDLEREWYSGDRIVLDDLVRDGLMLEMPMNPRCSESCPGWPGSAGVDSEFAKKEDRSIDPRLAPLGGIRLNKET